MKTCLELKAEGKSYIEMAELLGLSYHQVWCLCNRDRQRELRQRWRADSANRERENSGCRKYKRAYRKTPEGKLQRRINETPRRLGLQPCEIGPFKLLGCSIPQLRAHIESQWQKDMTWDNYGTWEVDHIKPLVLYPSVSLDVLLHFTNLQPLWVIRHRQKSASERGRVK